MTINLKMLKEMDACEEGIDWFKNKYDNDVSIIVLQNDLIAENKERWLNWFIANKLSKHNRVSYAIYAAEQVLHIFEKKYPDDKRPRLAIDAAKKYLENKNAAAAYAAAAAAYAAADAAAADAAAAYAADAAAAAAAAYAAAADDADDAAADDAAAAKKEMFKKILDYGVELLKVYEMYLKKTRV